MQRARTQEDKQKRQKAILDAALEIFFQSGFKAARMDDIAKRAGVSKGTLYLYFPSKGAVFEGLIDTIAMPNLTLLQNIARDSHDVPTAIRNLFSVVPTLLQSSDMPRLTKIIIGESNTFPGTVNAYRRTIIDPMLETISSVLETGHNRGEISIQDPMLTTRLLFAPIAFSGMWEIVFSRNDKNNPKAQVDLDALMQLHADLFIRAITPQKDKP